MVATAALSHHAYAIKIVRTVYERKYLRPTVALSYYLVAITAFNRCSELEDTDRSIIFSPSIPAAALLICLRIDTSQKSLCFGIYSFLIQVCQFVVQRVSL